MERKIKVRCQDCGKISDVKKSEIDETSCDCGGDLAELNSEDDTYEPEKCSICKKDIRVEDGEPQSWTCEECDEETVCEDCIAEFENLNSSICINCVKEACKDITTTVEYKDKIVEKIVEKPIKVFVNQDGVPIDNSFDLSNKSKFD